MPGSNWQSIDKAPRGIGPLLLRIAAGPHDPTYVGYQGNDGRWFTVGGEVRPIYFCTIPQFDCDEAAQ